jgi:hypothetical protein
VAATKDRGGPINCHDGPDERSAAGPPTNIVNSELNRSDLAADDAARGETAPIVRWLDERRADGVVLVRMPSRPTAAGALPDAVFTFRPGDPQYKFWRQQASGPRSQAG